MKPKHLILLLLIISCNKKLMPEVHTNGYGIIGGIMFTDTSYLTTKMRNAISIDSFYWSDYVDTLINEDSVIKYAIDVAKRFQLYDTIPIVLMVVDTSMVWGYVSKTRLDTLSGGGQITMLYYDSVKVRKDIRPTCPNGYLVREKYYYDTDSLRYIASDGQPMLKPQYKTIGYLDENKKTFPKNYLIKPFL